MGGIEIDLIIYICVKRWDEITEFINAGGDITGLGLRLGERENKKGENEIRGERERDELS